MLNFPMAFFELLLLLLLLFLPRCLEITADYMTASKLCITSQS